MSVDPESKTDRKKKVHVETWGCQMNVADSERMLAMLTERNYELTYSPEDADLVLLNTCHIREKANHKVVSRLGRLKEIKSRNPAMKIAVSGCVAQAEGRRLLKVAPQIDILFGPGKIDELPRLLAEQEANGQSAVALGFKSKGNHSTPLKADAAGVTLTGKNEVTRYVNIQQGCNNYCTFCVVPFTRGREISLTAEDIVAECQAMIAGGAREITLLGQNVNSYGLDLVEAGKVPESAHGPFVDLLRQVVSLPGLDRLRFTTSNPHDFTEPLAALFTESRVVGRYIHLPVQSGSDEVLSRMKRKVTVAEYDQRINWLRAAHPDMAISTDLIVGFPGETDAQFEETLTLVERCQFSFIFSFKYSSRANTVAARFTDQIPDDVKDSRLARLNALQDSITLKQQLAEVGKEREVLFLYQSKKNPGNYYGRTEHNRLVRVNAARDIVGSLIPVKIVDGNKTALVGELL